ncbi:unnamed protein product [Clonostachys rosea]|uniref:BZIP domain-containing protein n=1 Tax=Bionectria ochroleuca TaxID=29856 RepID=A0ABY6UQD8_BIOOC|nr:unnamed protein product [Clonostachys rosea]
MDAGALGASGTSTIALVRSADALGNERRLLEIRGQFPCHRTVSMTPGRAAQGELPGHVHSTRPDHLATHTQGAAPISRAPALPTAGPPSLLLLNDISKVAHQPPVPSDLIRLAYEAPNDRPSVVGLPLPVHDPPSYHVPNQSGPGVDPELANAPDNTLKLFSASTQLPPMKIVEPSMTFPLPDPSFAGSSYGLAESTGSLNRHMSMGVPPMIGLNQPSWARTEPDSSHTGSYGQSGTFQQPDSSSSSDCLSLEDDPLMLENSNRFPPRMPTAPPFASRSSARKKIQSWVSAHKMLDIQEPGLTDPLDNASSEDASDALSEASDESYSSSHADFEEQWRLLNQKRKRVRDLKAIMAEKRRSLKTLRQQKTNADNAFMSAMRPLMVDKTALQNEAASQLNTRMEEMQRLRTEYQDLETGYEELEDEVGQEEEQLERIEFRFFSLLGGEDGELSDDSSSEHDDSLVNDLPDELLGISPDRPLKDWHPLFYQLTLAVASLHSAQEEVTSLQLKNKFCEDRWAERGHGQKLAREMADFLVDYPTLVKTKKAELDECRQEIDRLRAMCEERQAMGKHLPVSVDVALNSGVDPGDLVLPDNETILREYRAMPPTRFSEILSQPDHLLASPQPLTAEAAKKVADRLPDTNPDKLRRVRLATKELEVDSLSLYGDEEDDKNNNINRWLLHNLRSSPLDASLLHSIFETTQGLRILNPHRWQRDVLYYWWRDKIPRITNFTETSARRSISRAVSEGANETQISYRQRKAYSTS